ncbi:hypothetical protein [Streptomyces minutiscleroticus]|uniref:hypothetical protein n=1 Tax=Streptomyces minutiscleroticus TaxID=68238 RepID=UPI00332D8D79
MRTRTRTTWASGAAAAGLTAALAFTSPAAADSASGTTDQAQTATHCVQILAELEPGQKVSRTVSHRCFTGPSAAAQAKSAAPAASVELMTWATDINYGGEYTHVYGGAACDSAGYSFSPNSWWSSRLSSYLVSGGCTMSFARGDRGNATFTGDVPYVGAQLNDDIDYIKIWRG